MIIEDGTSVVEIGICGKVPTERTAQQCIVAPIPGFIPQCGSV